MTSSYELVENNKLVIDIVYVLMFINVIIVNKY